MTRLAIVFAALVTACEMPSAPVLPCELGGADCPPRTACVAWEIGDARCEAPLPLPPDATRVPPELCGTCGFPMLIGGVRFVFCMPEEYEERCPHE